MIYCYLSPEVNAKPVEPEGEEEEMPIPGVEKLMDGITMQQYAAFDDHEETGEDLLADLPLPSLVDKETDEADVEEELPQHVSQMSFHQAAASVDGLKDGLWRTICQDGIEGLWLSFEQF